MIPVTMSNFKIGILSEIWEYFLDESNNFNADTRFYLQVADHVTDYHQNYLIPNLVKIRSTLQKVRLSTLTYFLEGLSSLERTNISFFLANKLPHSASSLQNKYNGRDCLALVNSMRDSLSSFFNRRNRR